MSVDEAEEEYDEELPFSMDELETEDDEDETESQMKVLGFAEGGFVDPKNPVTGDMTNPGKEPQKFGVGFSLFGPTSRGVVDALTRYVSKTYVNDKGEQRVITFGPNGTPLTPIPTGFYEMGTTPPTQQEKKEVDTKNWDTENESRSDATTGEGGALSGRRAQDFSQFSEEDFMRQAEERLSGARSQGRKGSSIGVAIGAVTGLGLVAGVAGGLIGKGTRVADALGLANMAEEKGYVDTAEAIRARVSKSMEDEGFGTRTILDLTAKGNWYKKANYTGTGATPSTTSTPASRTTTSSRGIDRSESTYAPAPTKTTPASKPADRTAPQPSGTQLSFGSAAPKGTATGTSTSASGRSTGTTGTPASNTTPGGYSLGTPSKPAPRGGSVGAFNKGGLATKRKKK